VDPRAGLEVVKNQPHTPGSTKNFNTVQFNKSPGQIQSHRKVVFSEVRGTVPLVRIIRAQ